MTELFNLVAKLTLDSKEYERAISNAEQQGGHIHDIEANLDLDTQEFDDKIDEASSEQVDVNDATLDLDKHEFDEKIDAADAEHVDDKESTLDLDAEPFKQELEEAEAESGSFETSVGGIFENIKGLIVASGVVAAITAIVDSLGEAVDLARSMGDNIDKSSRAMSMSTDTYQKLDYVMQINGASITDLNRGLMTMRRLLAGEATEEAVTAFEKLGISTRKANGELKTTEELTLETLHALADYDESDRDYLVQAIFGRNGTKLNALFDGTGEDIDYLMNKAEELGLVLSDDAIKNAVEYNDALTTLHAEIDAIKVAFVETILPLLTNAVTMVTEILAFFNPNAGVKNLSDQFADTDKELSNNLLTIEATSNAAFDLIDKLLGMGDATKLTAEEQAIWRENAQWLITNIPELSSVIDVDTMSITANKDEIYANIEAWKAYAIQRAKNNALQAKEEALAAKTTQWLDAEAKAREIDRKMMVEQEKLNIILKRDFEAMPKEVQTEVSIKLGYETPEAIDWGDDLTYRRLENMLGWGGTYSFYGSRELDNQISVVTAGMNSLAVEAKAAHDEADALKAEVEAGQAELAEYSATLDEVVGDLFDTGEQADQTTKEVEKLNEALNALPDGKTIQIGLSQTPLRSSYMNAKGNWTVPYDNFPALLHRDETVLTSSQARRYKEGDGNVDYGVIGEMIGTAVNKAMSKVYIMMSGEKVGDLTTRRVNNNINASSYSKLRSMGG